MKTVYSELRGTEIYDGDTKIADVIREPNRYAEEGFILCIIPMGNGHWKKYIGQEPDMDYIGRMYACSICRGCATADYYEPTKSRLLSKKICFSCDHWQQIIEADRGPNKDIAVVVNSKHYQMGANTLRPHRWSGFGGREWHIKFFDGRDATCNNLWGQGDIPERWRVQLPDNAVFA